MWGFFFYKEIKCEYRRTGRLAFCSRRAEEILEKFRQELPGFNGRNGGCPEIVNISRNDVIEI